MRRAWINRTNCSWCNFNASCLSTSDEGKTIVDNKSIWLMLHRFSHMQKWLASKAPIDSTSNSLSRMTNTNLRLQINFSTLTKQLAFIFIFGNKHLVFFQLLLRYFFVCLCVFVFIIFSIVCYFDIQMLFMASHQSFELERFTSIFLLLANSNRINNVIPFGCVFYERGELFFFFLILFHCHPPSI